MSCAATGGAEEGASQCIGGRQICFSACKPSGHASKAMRRANGPSRHQAITDGDEAEVQRLLQEGHHASANAPCDGALPLHHAASGGFEQVAAALLDAHPATASTRDERDGLPVHSALRAQQVSTARRLLRAGPHTAGETVAYPNACCRGATLLHLAAEAGSPDLVALLLAWNAEMAQVLTAHGHSALDHAVFGSRRLGRAPACHVQACVRLLLAAAPEAALWGDKDGDTPLHNAAMLPHRPACGPELVALLAAAEPRAAELRNHGGRLPLECALLEAADRQRRIERAEHKACSARAAEQAASSSSPPERATVGPKQHATKHDALWLARLDEEREALEAYLQSAHALLPYSETDALLAALLSAGPVAHPLLADLAAARPLTAQQWALLPSPCPELGAALTPVAARSAEEAACLVARLGPAQRERLRAFLLSLGRVQRWLGLALPSHLVACLLGFLI